MILGPKFEFRESWIYCYLRSIILHYFSPGFHFKSFLKAQHKSIMQANLEPSLRYSNSFHLDIVFMSSKPLQWPLILNWNNTVAYLKVSSCYSPQATVVYAKLSSENDNPVYMSEIITSPLKEFIEKQWINFKIFC